MKTTITQFNRERFKDVTIPPLDTTDPTIPTNRPTARVWLPEWDTHASLIFWDGDSFRIDFERDGDDVLTINGKTYTGSAVMRRGADGRWHCAYLNNDGTLAYDGSALYVNGLTPAARRQLLEALPSLAFSIALYAPECLLAAAYLAAREREVKTHTALKKREAEVATLSGDLAAQREECKALREGFAAAFGEVHLV